VKVDVSCKRCGAARRLEIGAPAAGQTREEYLHVVKERLAHRPSFDCFGGHSELRPPVPEFWVVDWETLGD
jgi:hypothetical protein